MGISYVYVAESSWRRSLLPDDDAMTRPEYRKPKPGFLRWSASSLTQYLRCQMAYWFRFSDYKHNRIDDGKRTNVALATGSAIHRASAVAAVTRKYGGDIIRESSFVDHAVSSYDEECKSNEVSEAPGIVVKHRDDVVACAQEYARSVLPKLPEAEKILMVEVPLYAYLEDDQTHIELCGTMDRIDVGSFDDTKTSRAWHQDEADRSVQFSIYDALYRANFKGDPEIRVANIARTGKGWFTQTVTTRRSAEDRSALWQILRRSTIARAKGSDMPAPEGSWYCSKKWCPFWNDCPAVIGKRSRE